MQEVGKLEQHAKNIRKLVILALAHAGSGHTAGSLGLADLLAAIYGDILAKNDKFMLSNGHVAPVQYAALAEFGFIPAKEIQTLREFGSRLQGHPERTKMPEFLATTSGPLGEGLGQAAGMALAAQRDEEQYKRHIYVVAGDGELQEGNLWESAMFASNYNLGNLILYIDRNEIQISGNTENVMKIEPLNEKFESFGWHVQEIDGNNIEAILDTTQMAKNVTDRPSVIICHTIPGKGVEEIEGDYLWHGKAPTAVQAHKWIKELE